MIDSGAVKRVCDDSWGKNVMMKPVSQDLKLKTASGAPLKHYGPKDVNFETKEAMIKMGLEVLNVAPVGLYSV